MTGVAFFGAVFGAADKTVFGFFQAFAGIEALVVFDPNKLIVAVVASEGDIHGEIISLTFELFDMYVFSCS